MSKESRVRLVVTLVMGAVIAACSGAATTPPQSGPAVAPPAGSTGAGQTGATGTQPTGGSGSLFANAKAVKHFCDLLPTDLIPGIIDNPTPPQEEQFPPRCSVFGGKTAMAIWLDVAVPLSAPPAGATPIQGLGTGAYLERLAAGNFTLYVGLSPDGGVLATEVNNQDGKDHTDQAVSVAKAVLQKLGG